MISAWHLLWIPVAFLAGLILAALIRANGN